jgi:hypothetical protein
MNRAMDGETVDGMAAAAAATAAARARFLAASSTARGAVDAREVRLAGAVRELAAAGRTG